MTPCFEADVAAQHARGYRGDGVGIGHLDTGVDGAHPALHGRVERFMCFEASGFESAPASPTDRAGHGTHTAGLIVGGVCEGRQIGIAPAATLHAGAVIEEGNVVARMLMGLDWLADSGVSVVNLSFGVRGPTPVFRSLIRAMVRRNILVVCPIGNSGAGIACTPGAYPEVLSVGAIGPDRRVARFSGSAYDDSGRECRRPDVVASGVEVVSLAPGGGVTRVSGTSVSSAVVAGLAAVLRQAFPRAPATAIKSAIVAAASPLAEDQRMRARCGSVRPLEAFAALERWRGEVTPPPDQFLADDAAETKFVDKRLLQQLANRQDDDHADAVFEFASQVEADKACHALGAQECQPPRIVRLRNAPSIIFRGRAAAVQRMLENPSLVIASACDMDRSLWKTVLHEQQGARRSS